MNILRNLMCSTSPMLWAPDDAGNPTQAEKNATERAKIAVTNNGGENEEKEETEVEETKEETEEEVEVETEEETETEETETSTEVEATAETKAVDKLKKTIERLQRRIDKKTGSESELRKELKLAKDALDAKKEAGETVLTEDEVNTRAKKIADEQLTAREFTRDCNKLLDDAVKIDKKFESKIKALAEDIGDIPSQMIGILSDLDNGGAVLAHLADPINADEAETIWSLSMPKMTLKLVKLSDKIEADAKKAKEKRVSKVPPPNEPLGGKGATVVFDPRNTKVSDKDWIEQRNRQVAERNAAKRASMR